MRIVFIGTPEFAAYTLNRLLDESFDVVGVVTAPDKPSGRGQKLKPSPVKILAQAHGILVLQPTNLKNPDFLAELKSLKADIQVVVAFRMLPEAVWNMPPLGTYNLHASLLPDYRGAAPINWAIVNGETTTGVTTFKLKHEIDTGNLLLQKQVKIAPQTNAGELHDQLMVVGAQLVIDSLRLIESGNYELKAQPIKEDVKRAPKIAKSDLEINWNKPALEIHNFVRGMSPFPGAYCVVKTGAGTEKWKILKTEVRRDRKNQAPIELQGEELFFKTEDYSLAVLELQAPGKKRMSTPDFLRGFQHLASLSLD